MLYRKWMTSAVIVLMLMLSACAGRYVRIGQKGMTCVEAHQNAMATVSRLGYTIGEVKKPVPGSPGTINGSRPEEVGGGSVFVQVFCTDLGAEIEAKSDSGGVSDLDFAQKFEKTFATVSTTKTPVRQAAATGADVLLHIENAAGGDFGGDISGSGVLPVNVRISNQSKTKYKFNPSNVVFMDAQGNRQAPLSVKEATVKMTAPQADNARQKALGERDINPGDTVTGYLFVPFRTYSRARVSLIERGTDEEEGFSIDF